MSPPARVVLRQTRNTTTNDGAIGHPCALHHCLCRQRADEFPLASGIVSTHQDNDTLLDSAEAFAGTRYNLATAVNDAGTL